MSPASSLCAPKPGRSTTQAPRVTMWNCAHPLPFGACSDSQLPPNCRNPRITGRILNSGTIAFNNSAASASDIPLSLIRPDMSPSRPAIPWNSQAHLPYERAVPRMSGPVLMAFNTS